MAIGNPITLTNNIADKVSSLTATADQTYSLFLVDILLTNLVCIEMV